MTTNTEKLDRQRLTRVIGQYPVDPSNQTAGPYLLVSGGVHGNEPSGVLAIQRIFEKLKNEAPELTGKIIGVTGNVTAMKKGVRLVEKDLNRICTSEFERQLKSGKADGFQEALEFHELTRIVERLENEEMNTEMFFMDLHTTSSETIPYISVNQLESSFSFAKRMPLPVVKGIEKFIPGHFDHFLTLKGHTGFTMEAGQHEDPKSVDYHEAAIWVILVRTGMLEEKAIDYEYYYKLLSDSSATEENFEVTYRQEIQEGEVFKMDPGFSNFSKITQGQRLATLNGEVVSSNADGRIFLPLYQSQGSDGFFIVQPV